ncbi:MAG TPA: hypothetical protein VD886_20170 [Herpetosiphonaceae bacterium]|nr:hypothetical protein [Herpetosiphonaceae bacterium]
MATAAKKIEVYLERGKKRTVAGVLGWPGWCRAGGDEDEALAALQAAGQRYADVLDAAGINVPVPADGSAFAVVERLAGKGATDMGIPVIPPSLDADPVDAKDMERLQAILKACWKALDKAAEHAEGKTLRLGPRGGGRDLDGILEHVRGAEQGYLASLGGKAPKDKDGQPDDQAVRKAILETLEASARGEIPAKGPRGGTRWSPRYCVRRMAWHILDHIWELEDRAAD